LVCAEYGYPKGCPNAKVKEEIRRYSSQYSARLSAHPDNVIVNLIEQPHNRRLPNDLLTRFLVVFVVLVFKLQFVSFIPKSHKRP
jgi:hypothetical protein